MQEINKRLNHFVKLVHLNTNIGYGHGIMKGVEIASGEVIAWTHADLQTDPLDILEAHKKFITHPEYPKCIMKGKRVGRNFIDSMFTSGMGFLASVLLRSVC